MVQVSSNLLPFSIIAQHHEIPWLRILGPILSLVSLTCPQSHRGLVCRIVKFLEHLAHLADCIPIEQPIT